MGAQKGRLFFFCLQHASVCSCVCVCLKLMVHVLSFFKCVTCTKYQQSAAQNLTGQQICDDVTSLRRFSTTTSAVFSSCRTQVWKDACGQEGSHKYGPPPLLYSKDSTNFCQNQSALWWQADHARPFEILLFWKGINKQSHHWTLHAICIYRYFSAI